MTHTPWMVNSVGFRQDYRTFVVDSELHQIAEIHGKTEEEAENHANLIAAAPELLAACQELLIHEPAFESSQTKRNNAWSKLRAAIAEATE